MDVPADEYDIHVNFPGGVPIDGPSAGIAMATGIYSAIYKVPIETYSSNDRGNKYSWEREANWWCVSKDQSSKTSRSSRRSLFRKKICNQC